jgi:MFS family permease
MSYQGNQGTHQHTDGHHELLELIRARRASIQGFIRDLEPRGKRLSVISIVSSAVVSALTAGPALGGTKFTEMAASMTHVGDDSFIWRGLCLAAMALSILAAISTNMLRSSEAAGRLAKAEACNAALEGLETMLHFGQIPMADAVTQYQQHVVEIPFIPELLQPAAPVGHQHYPPPPRR